MPAPYVVRFLAEPPPLDGRWDQGAWSGTDLIGPFLRHDGTTARYPTEARLGYDDEYLYTSFYCLDDDIWGTFRKRDEPLYDEEVVEIYLDVEEDGRNYFEFELSPHNVVFDCINSWRGNRLAWDAKWDCPGLLTGVAYDGTLDNADSVDLWWSATLAIPFEGMAVDPPQPGDTWRVNLYRIERPRIVGEDEFQAWKPTQDPGETVFFNVPQRFATVVFGPRG